MPAVRSLSIALLSIVSSMATSEVNADAAADFEAAVRQLASWKLTIE